MDDIKWGGGLFVRLLACCEKSAFFFKLLLAPTKLFIFFIYFYNSSCKLIYICIVHVKNFFSFSFFEMLFCFFLKKKKLSALE